MGLPSRLKSLRLEKKLTQEQLGKKINVTKVSISGYEKGTRTPDLDTLQRIADFFDTSVDYLLGRTDEPHPLGYDPDKVEAIFAHRRDDYMQELSEADQKQIEKILKEIAHLVAQREKKKEDDDNGRD